MVYEYYKGYGCGYSRYDGGSYWYLRKYPNILFKNKMDMFEFIDAMKDTKKVIIEKMSL